MRVLFVTQYYFPETGASPNRISDWVQRLASWGHELTVLTAVPNYPKGEVFEGYRERNLYDVLVDNIRILRTRIFVTKNSGFPYRLLNYFSFVFACILVGLSKIGPQDVVIIESPPLFLGLAGLVLKKKLRSKLVFNVSDLWPESAVALGVVRNKMLIRFSVALEEFIYRHSDLITGQTESIIHNIQARIPRIPTALITNGVDLTLFQTGLQVHKNENKHNLELGDKFVVGYAGLHGLAQGLDIIVSAADQLRDEKDIVFALFGDGPEKARLIQEAQTKHLDNVEFFAPEPKEKMAAIMASFDAGVVPLRGLDLFKGALPCKLFESMAAGTPVIVSIEGEARTLVEKARGGICIPPEDAQALAKAILELRSNPELRTWLGRSGREYVAAHYNRLNIAKRLEGHLLGLVAQDKAPEYVGAR